MSDEKLQALHDKRTRGLSLSAEEEASLVAWYAQQDKEEAAALNGVPEPGSIEDLRAQVQAANTELLAVTQHIQTTANENAKLREELTVLQEQVKKRAKTQPV